MGKICFDKAGFGTKAIHAGQEPEKLYGALATPIYQTSTFCFETVEQGMSVFKGETPGFAYSRSGNPTKAALEAKLACLECGEACVATGSGMGAVGSVLVAFLKAGDHVICEKCIYGCSALVMRETLTKFGVEVTFLDTSNIDEIEKAITPRTKIIYFETPTNPTMKITDIQAVSELGHTHNIMVVVDNTFAPPPVQYPLKLGADIVVHSVTKYLNGHGDVIGGAVIGRADDIKLVSTTAATKICGSAVSPFNAFLTLRGIQTLELRMQRHSDNALAVAKYLEGCKFVKQVYYPGLESSPQHELAKRQMNGMYSGIMSFELKDGINGEDSLTSARRMINRLNVASIAVSLGDPGTLIQHPASMTHANMPEKDRLEAGITNGMIRLSVGLENIEDIIGDFEQAFSVLEAK